MKKVLVTYFSHSGNTKVVAEKISSVLNGDLFEIKTLDTYPV
ncbi:MAG: flavodoxin, partial [Erysipelotrichaceae bacterium]|nr:flavodoxin [Erysipelotrichaceae bacterium]